MRPMARSYRARTTRYLARTGCSARVRTRGLDSLSLWRSPGQVASQILPEAVQSPDHMQLPVRKMLQKAIADEPDDILPIVVAFVCQFLLEHGTYGNHCSEGVSEDDKLQK